MDSLSYNERTCLALGAASIGSLALSAAALVYSPKHAIGQRLVVVAVLLVLARFMVVTLLERTHNAPWIAILSGVIGFEFFSIAETLVISRVDANDLADGNRQMGQIGLLHRAAALTVNCRRIGTKWQIDNVAKAPSQSRVWFIVSNLIYMTLAYSMVEMSESQPPPEPHLVAPEKETLYRLWDLTAEELIFRFVFTLMYWFLGALWLYFMARAIAVFSVATGLSRPESWPPIYGPFATLTTVRGFWGKFWHQTLRKGITGIGDAISDSILGLPRGTLVSRYTRLFIAFLFSGLIHHASGSAYGLSHSATSSIQFFCLQALGIMFEDTVQAATKRLPIPAKARAAIGYAWTLLFLSLTTPAWFYPTVRQGEMGRLTIIPVVRRLM